MPSPLRQPEAIEVTHVRRWNGALQFLAYRGRRIIYFRHLFSSGQRELGKNLRESDRRLSGVMLDVCCSCCISYVGF